MLESNSNASILLLNRRIEYVFFSNEAGQSSSKPAVRIREPPCTPDVGITPGGETTLHTHNLSSGETQAITISARKEQSLMNELEQALAGIEQQGFTPRPDPYTCATCPFFLVCPA